MRRVLALLLCLGCALPAPAQDVELELVLLADSSGSIDYDELLFQRQSYAEALQSPEVLGAIASTAYQRIAVTYVEWAGVTSQDVVVDWTIIAYANDAAGFAAALETAPARAFGRNAIGAALLKGKALIEGNDITSWRQVIDFSGDSVNNYGGPSIASARREVLEAGITINGLALLCRFCSGRPGNPNLEADFRDRIIGGIGSFVITAEDAAGFTEAVKKKLILEIAGRTPEDAPVPAAFRP
jgi:hypothetical protein